MRKGSLLVEVVVALGVMMVMLAYVATGASQADREDHAWQTFKRTVTQLYTSESLYQPITGRLGRDPMHPHQFQVGYQLIPLPPGWISQSQYQLSLNEPGTLTLAHPATKRVAKLAISLGGQLKIYD